MSQSHSLWAAAAAVLARATRPMHFSMVAKRIADTGLFEFTTAEPPPPLQVRDVLQQDCPAGPLFGCDGRGYFTILAQVSAEDMPPVRAALDTLEKRKGESDDEQAQADAALAQSTVSSESAPNGEFDSDELKAENRRLRAGLRRVEQQCQEMLEQIQRLRGPET